MKQMNKDNKNKLYYIEESQKIILEKKIAESLSFLKKICTKEEILKFLFKSIEDGKYDFNEENGEGSKQLTEEEISEKKDKFCREIKEIFDTIPPIIFQKYHNRIATATINIITEINTRKEIINNPKRKVKIERINQDCKEKKLTYNKLDAIKNLIKETIYVSSFYNTELVNKNGTLFQDLNKFYNDKSEIELVNNINGEEKKAKDDEIIKKVINAKENKGKQFIIDTKNYINEMINEQNILDKKISHLVDEMNDIKEQTNAFEQYCNNNNSIFKDINEFDYYE